MRADGCATLAEMATKPVERIDRVVIRFAGDSGDGMQLTGSWFTSETALFGNDLSTLPDFPAEIRAPAGSLPGVSGFQIHFADRDILTPGDAPNVLVAMNPAALKTNLRDLPNGGTLIVNADAFTDRNLEKAGYAENPLEDASLDEYAVHRVPLTSLTIEALKDVDVTKREAERAKNMFALGLMSWLYHRPTDGTVEVIRRKFTGAIAEANERAFKAGWAYGETSEDFAVTYEVAPAKLRPGTYRNITGNQALALGLVAASVQSKLPLFLGAYPITPASALLEDLSRHKSFGIRTFQAEDEIAAVGASLGASFGGALAVTHVERPGDRAQDGDDRAGDRARAAARDRRRPARRPVDRDADEAGAGRSADGALRPQLGVAGAGRRRLDAERLLRRRDRGGADRAQVPDAGLPALRRVPGERLGAVVPPGGRVAAGHLDDVRDGAEPRRRLLAVPARPGHARPRMGDPGDARASSTASAASRSRTAPAASPTTRTTTTTWFGCAPPRSRASTSRPCTSTPRAARSCSCSAGAGRTGRSAPRCAVCARTAARSRTRI